MKIGVISDTHIPGTNDGRYLLENKVSNNPELLCEMLKPVFNNVDAVLHAGDITSPSVLEWLEQFGKVFAVAGNMDSAEMRQRLGEKRIIELNGFKIGLVHGWGGAEGLSSKIKQKFMTDDVDCIVFGHSHQPYNKIEDNILMFNPGSPTDKRFAESNTVGILHLDENIRGEHITLY
jgi:uncharacterized protein